MVNESKNLKILLVVLITISTLILFIPHNSNACGISPGTLYLGRCGDRYCTSSEYCVLNTIYGYYPNGWASGCAFACYIGEAYLNKPTCLVTSGDGIYGTCECSGQVKRIIPTPCDNGQTCIRETGTALGFGCGDTKWGNWDKSEGKCVVCSGKKENGYFNCNGDYSGNNKCESACGASDQCDEQSPNSYLLDYCTYNYLEVNRYCDSNCQYSSIKYYCNADNCGKSQSCEDETYYCVYDNGWKWSTSKPTDFCCSDADCPVKNNIKGKCRSPQGTGGTPYDYRCVWPKCEQDSDCVSGTKCYCGACSSTHTSAGCPAGQCCDRDYGGSGIGSCVGKGTIRNIGGKSYLCDPPFENLESIDSKEKNLNYITKLKALYSSVVNFLSHFFTQR